MLPGNGKVTGDHRADLIEHARDEYLGDVHKNEQHNQRCGNEMQAPRALAPTQDIEQPGKEGVELACRVFFLAVPAFVVLRTKPS